MIALARRCQGCHELLPPSRRGRRRWHDECLQEHRHQEARAKTVTAIQRWAAEHGEPPKAQDWNPQLARRRGRDQQAVRFECQHWPHATVVARLFGSWNAAITAAGYTPRSNRPA